MTDCFLVPYKYSYLLTYIWSVRRFLSPQALLTLIRALVISKVDYCNSILVCVSGHLVDRLKSVLNGWYFDQAIRPRQSTDVKATLAVRVPERIQFWLCIMTYHCLNGRHHLICPTVCAEPLLLMLVVVV